MPDPVIARVAAALAPPARSGLLVAWMNSWLRGVASSDDTLAAVGGSDEPHLAQHADGVAMPLGWVFGTLRGSGIDGLSLVLPASGDPRGLPAGTELECAALRCGEAAVGAGWAAVPVVTRHGSAIGSQAVTVTWAIERGDWPRPDVPPVHEMEHELTEAVRDAASDLAALQVASWRPELAAASASIRAGRHIALPPDHDPAAARLLAQAERLAAVLELAAIDAPGGAVTAGQARGRAEALRPLSTAVRRARMAGYSATPRG